MTNRKAELENKSKQQAKGQSSLLPGSLLFLNSRRIHDFCGGYNTAGLEKYARICYNDAISLNNRQTGRCTMSFAEELKKIRQHSFLSQEMFARELEVSFSSVNRWEGGKSKPNLAAMKKIKDYCERQDIDFSTLEREWYEIGKEA